MKDTTPLNFELPQLLWVPVHLLTRVMYNTYRLGDRQQKYSTNLRNLAWNKKKKLLVLKEIMTFQDYVKM